MGHYPWLMHSDGTPIGTDTTRREGAFPFEKIVGDPHAGLILLCDHASNQIPDEYADLGLSRENLCRHIAFDIGAAALTRALAVRLGVPALLSCFSRLLIDPNRGEDDPTLIMRLSDGAVIKGNARLSEEERSRRIVHYYRPYHEAISDAVDLCLASGRGPMILSIHSFTPIWKGWPRPWHAGVLWDEDPRLALALIEALAEDKALVVGDNEPYSGGLPNDTLHRHGEGRGLASAVLEIRQDLIGDEAGIADWTGRLAHILTKLIARTAVGGVEYYSSKADR